MSPPPGSPMGLLWRERDTFPEPSFTYLLEFPITRPDKTKSRLPLKVPGIGAYLDCHPGPLWGEMLHFQSQWFINSFIHISQSPQLRSFPTKLGKRMVTVHGSPCGLKAYITMWCCLVLQGDLCDPSVTTPVFSTVPSTLAWVDQSPISQHVS